MTKECLYRLGPLYARAEWYLVPYMLRGKVIVSCRASEHEGGDCKNLFIEETEPKDLYDITSIPCALKSSVMFCRLPPGPQHTAESLSCWHCCLSAEGEPGI